MRPLTRTSPRRECAIRSFERPLGPGARLGTGLEDLISKDTQKAAIPTMCNWNTFQSAPNKIYNVPVLTSVWCLGHPLTRVA